MGGDALELFAVDGGEGGQLVFPAGGQGEADLAVINGVGGAADVFLAGEAVGQADGTVVLDLKALGEFADGDVLTAGEAFDGEEGLMLLGGKAGGMGGVFTEAEELPEGVAELGKILVMSARKCVFGLHVRDFLAQDEPDDKPNRLEIYRSTI